MKIAVTPVSLSRTFRSGGMDQEKFIAFCAEQEIDGIDALDSNCYPWFWKDKDSDFKKLPGLLRRSGLELAAYATGNNFAKTAEDERKAHVEIVTQALEEASELKAPFLRIFGGYHREAGGEEQIETDIGLEMVISGIEKCLPSAEKLGVVMALENHGRLPAHSYELKGVVEHFASPFVKVMFDCANFMANSMDEPENPLDAYARLKEHVVHAHVKDMGPCISNNFRRLEGYVAGKGIVPLKQFVALLEEDGYRGFCSLEYEASAISPEEYGVPESLDYLKKIRRVHEMMRKMKSN